MDGIHAALVAAQAAMGNPPLDGSNPHYRSRYATLKSVLDSVRGPLNAQGLMLNQTLEDGELKTVVWNGAGESECVCRVPCQLPSDVQKAGSCLTYIRRYSLLAAFGLVGDPDDDGEGACAEEVPEQGPFTARCRTCGRAYSMASREGYMGFLSSPDARCCSRPDWRVER